MSEKRSFENPFKDFMTNNSVIDSESDRLKEEIRNRLLENINNLLNYFEKNVSKSLDISDYSVYTGITGIALLYLHLSRVLTEDSIIKNQLLDKCLSFVEPIIKILKGRKHSFICGDCGPLTVACFAQHLKSNQNQCNRLLNSLKSMISYAIDINTELADEVLYGRSGFLYSLLFVRKYIPNSDQIIDNNDIRSVVDAILRSGKRTADRERNGSPLMYYWHEKAYIGCAHGLSGIMFMLLEAKDYLKNEEMLELVKPTIDFILSLRLPSGNYPSSLGNPSDRLIHWCHGCPGVVHLFALAFVTFGDERYLKAAKECCDLIWNRGLLTKGMLYYLIDF
jgi:lantibiotic modifying enzyme